MVAFARVSARDDESGTVLHFAPSTYMTPPFDFTCVW